MVVPEKGQTEALPKRGYSMYFEPFDWVLGTGNYITILMPYWRLKPSILMICQEEMLQ